MLPHKEYNRGVNLGQNKDRNMLYAATRRAKCSLIPAIYDDLFSTYVKSSAMYIH